MPTYDRSGVRFDFPDDWTLSESSEPDQRTISVESPGTSLWVLTLRSDRPPADFLLETVIEAFREEYDQIDVYPESAPDGGDGTEVKAELEFVCLEMINSAWLHTFELPQATVLVMSQGTDHELTETKSDLDRISGSLAFDLFLPRDEGSGVKEE